MLYNNFCLLQIQDYTELCCIAEYLITHAVDTKKLNIDRCKLQNYIHVAFKGYMNQKFHNYHHALTVLNYTIILIKLIEKDVNYHKRCEQMSPIATVTLSISALLHDVQHPGNTKLIRS